MRRVLALALALLAGTVPAAAQERRVAISPYLEVDQQAVANLKGGDGDVLTYTGLAAGVEARVSTSTAQLGADVRYEHRIGWGKQLGDQDTVSGLVRGSVNTLHDQLRIDGGALATRSRSDFSGAGGTLGGDVDTVSNIYSAYVGPTIATQSGDLTATASYRLGYNKLEDDVGVALPGGGSLNSFDESVTQNATASIGMQPGPLPVGWAVGAGYDREDASQLDQRFEDKWIRADITVPVTPTLAAVGGVGYEKLEISQRDVLRDANGVPVVTPGGRYVSDKSKPRLLSYDFDGIIWDAGVLWRPSRRTTLDARVGQRYGSWRFTGNFAWQPDRYSSLNIVVFDGIDSFGRLMNASLSGLSSDFIVARNPFSGDLNSCAFATQGGAQCFSDALTGITGANFRHRGIAAQYSRAYGPWSWGVGLGYARRKFIAPDTGIFADIDGAVDENFYGNIVVTRKIDDVSGVDGAIYGNYYDTGLTGRLDVFNGGTYGSYYRNFGERLTARASLGLDMVDAKSVESIISALAQLGVRYQF
jgi:hypothetical protein